VACALTVGFPARITSERTTLPTSEQFFLNHGNVHPRSPRLLKDASAHTLVGGDLEAVFLPRHGMLGDSLRHRGVEILRRVENLETAAAKGSTAGIPLLYPWANRLASFGYRAAGREVTLDPSSPLLHLDANGLPIWLPDLRDQFP